MARIRPNSLASIRFELSWKSPRARHREAFLAQRVNFWRDILPDSLGEKLMGLAPGEEVEMHFQRGKVFPEHDKGLLREVKAKTFSPPRPDLIMAGPRVGRYYPRGMFRGIGDVYPQDMRPVRVVDKHRNTLLLDGNHPMASRAFTLRATVLEARAKPSETGGRLSHWLEEVCDYGPGMQVRAPNRDTDFFHPGALCRHDCRDDASFYQSPRLVGHVDAQASSLFRQFYGESLSPGDRVLDIMSGYQSHLPFDMKLRVIGLGLNRDEMAANPALSRRVEHDLNAKSELDFADGSFDAVVMSLSFEYLTDPRAVLAECRRVLVPGGRMLIGFSNRWFPAKVVALWPDLHEFERLGLVKQLLDREGFTELATTSARNWRRPNDDRHFLATRGISDPVYLVEGVKA